MSITIYTEDSSLKNKFTGIGKSVDVLFSTLNSLGCNLVVLESSKGNFWKDFFFYNFKLPKFCKQNLPSDIPFLIPNNMGKFFRLPHKNTWVLVHDIIPLSPRYGHKGIKGLLYKYKMSKLKKATRIFTISEYVKKDIVDKIGVTADKIDVLYWPNFYGESNVEFPKKNTKTFLGIGTGEKRKDIEEIIRFWINTPIDYHLNLYGKEVCEGRHKYLNELISSLGLTNRITLLGKVSEEQLSCLYENSDVFIFSSKEEGFGLPPLEALSHGTPIVVAKTPFNYELYGDIANFYSAGDEREFLYALNQAVTIPMEQNQLSKVLTRFSLSQFRNRIKYLIDEKKNSN